MTTEQIRFIKTAYQPGTGIRLIAMDREPQMSPGLKGVVDYVDDAGQIHTRWENGSVLALICGADQFIAFSGPTASEYLHSKYPSYARIWFREESPGCVRATEIDLERLIAKAESYIEKNIDITGKLAVLMCKPYETVSLIDAFLSDSILSDEGVREIQYKRAFNVSNSEAEICPKCGSNSLEYGAAELIDGAQINYPWKCTVCGSSGKEYGSIVFDGHEVTDSPYFKSNHEMFTNVGINNRNPGKKLRLLLFEDCNRNCGGCCNKDWDLNALPICSDFRDYSLIMLTGGEPMLRPEMIIEAIRKIRVQTQAPIILYTALFTDKEALGSVLDMIDGITATLHTAESIASFLEFDRFYKGRPGMSFRLNVFNEVGDISCSSRWKIKDGITWVKDCPLPSGETFMRFDSR